MSAKLKIDRMNPLLLPVGIESVLILGGMKKQQRGVGLVRTVEILDTRQKASALTDYRLPAKVK